MSITSTTKANGAKVATIKKPKTATGKSAAKESTHYELLPQEEGSENGTMVLTAEMESNSVPEVTDTATKKEKVTAAKSKHKKVEAAAAKPKPKKVETGVAKSKTIEVAAAKSKNVTQKKAVRNGKGNAVGNKKVRLAASTYHYYRNWLAEFMRSHGVPSAKFQKSPESYEGHITVSETEKAKGLKALEQWSKQNPDTKELFWDVKK